MVTSPDPSAPMPLPPVLTEALARLRFGDIRLTIHEGRLVQIDVTEKTRLTPAAGPASAT